MSCGVRKASTLTKALKVRQCDPEKQCVSCEPEAESAAETPEGWRSQEHGSSEESSKELAKSA